MVTLKEENGDWHMANSDVSGQGLPEATRKVGGGAKKKKE
jgi:hypothetical protein